MDIFQDLLYPEAVGFCLVTRARDVTMVSKCNKLSHLFEGSLFVSVYDKCTTVFEVSCYKLLKVNRLTLLFRNWKSVK